VTKRLFDCSRSTFGGEFDLSQASCTIYRDSASSLPPENLILDGFTYERFHDCAIDWKSRVAWLNRQPKRHLGQSGNAYNGDREIKSVFRPQPWVQCYEVLRKMGYDKDAKELAVCREKTRAHSSNTSRVSKIWYGVLSISVGYGYKPERALYWSMLFFSVGWLTFATAANMGFMSPRDGSVQAYLASKPNLRLPEHYTRFNAPIYALDNYLPIIELGQDTAWEPSDNQTGERRDKYLSSEWWEEATRLALGHDWAVTGSSSSSQLNGRLTQAGAMRGGISKQPTNVLARYADFVAGGIAFAFHLGVHRAVYWTMEILGWLFVSLYIAGMSGVMKSE
jgi:hypothetical protein